MHIVDQQISYDPINIGYGRDFSIRSIVDFICKYANFNGEILWDTSKPDGL